MTWSRDALRLPKISSGADRSRFDYRTVDRTEAVVSRAMRHTPHVVIESAGSVDLVQRSSETYAMVETVTDHSSRGVYSHFLHWWDARAYFGYSLKLIATRFERPSAFLRSRTSFIQLRLRNRDLMTCGSGLRSGTSSCGFAIGGRARTSSRKKLDAVTNACLAASTDAHGWPLWHSLPRTIVGSRAKTSRRSWGMKLRVA